MTVLISLFATQLFSQTKLALDFSYKKFKTRVLSMKKLINNPEDVVRENLAGMAVAHPDIIKVHFEPNFIYRADAPIQDKVAML